MRLPFSVALVCFVSAVAIASTRADDPTLDLILAAANGETGTVRFLLDKGVDVNSKDQFGDTALMYAANYGHIDTVKLLLARGAEVNVRSKMGGNTALMNAVIGRSIGIVSDLLDRGADVNAKSDSGATALVLAEESHQREIVRLLKQHGARN